MTDSILAPGSYYFYTPASRGRRFFSSFRSGSGDADERVRALSRGCNLRGAEGKNEPSPLTTGVVSPASYSLGGGAALVVRFGLAQVAGLGLNLVQPSVHYDPGTRTACVFSGHLANLEELADRYVSEPFDGPTSPSSILAARADPRQLAADTIMRMYLKERSGDLLVLLSELQGTFSFVVFDGEKRQVFAARDSSGSEPLFYELDDDGAISLSNSQPLVPADVGHVHWTELPPGHFISGRTPKVQQFALTPQQLTIREHYERSLDEEMSPRFFFQQHERDMRQSLSAEREPYFEI